MIFSVVSRCIRVSAGGIRRRRRLRSRRSAWRVRRQVGASRRGGARMALGGAEAGGGRGPGGGGWGEGPRPRPRARGGEGGRRGRRARRGERKGTLPFLPRFRLRRARARRRGGRRRRGRGGG